jgi:hypothetical protein
MNLVYSLLKRLRKLRVGNEDDPEYIGADRLELRGQAAADLIGHRLLEPGPLMAARFGKAELDNIIPYYLSSRAGFVANAGAYLRGELPQFWFKRFLVDDVTNNAGVFPRTRDVVRRFCQRVLDDAAAVDILGSWLTKEQYLRPLFPAAAVVAARDLIQPFRQVRPWTAALRGRRVLVIHPFVDTIVSQYRSKRALLFANQDVLPEFELLTLRAVQSIAGNTPPGFRDWFEACDAMCAQIDRIDFDVALIGCGSYAFSLCAHVKRSGRKAIQLAGSTQLLFGIKGKRWDKEDVGRRFYNEHWVRPAPAETPANVHTVEGGCYW